MSTVVLNHCRIRNGAGLALYRRRGWREAARIDHGATLLLVLVRDPTGVCP